MFRTACLLVMLAACGSVHRSGDDAGPPGDADPPGDGGSGAAAPGLELVGAAGHLASATYTFDVQLGHSMSQAGAASATYRMAGTPAVKP